MLFEGCWQGINPQCIGEDPSIQCPTYSSAHRCYIVLCNNSLLWTMPRMPAKEGWVGVIIYFGGQWLSHHRASPWCNAHVCCHAVKTFRSTMKKQNSQHPFILPSHFPSGLSVRRMISMQSPCLKVSSPFRPLWSVQARAWWRTSMGLVNWRGNRKYHRCGKMEFFSRHSEKKVKIIIMVICFIDFQNSVGK